MAKFFAFRSRIFTEEANATGGFVCPRVPTDSTISEPEFIKITWHTSVLSVCRFFAHIGRVLRLSSRCGFSRLRHTFGHIHRVACRLWHRASHRLRLLLRHILWVLPFGHILRHSVRHITLLASVGHSFCHHTIRHSIAFFRPAHTHHSCHHTAGTVAGFGIFTCTYVLPHSLL